MTLQNLKILLVEDDPIIQEHLNQLLRREGASIVGRAHNAIRAMDLLHTCSPEFIICDIHLGSGQSGIDVAEAIHSKYDLPYIFLTSFDDVATLEEAQKHSPYGYIVKPFNDRTLITTIKVALSMHHKKSSLQQLHKKSVQEQVGEEFTEQEFEILQLLVDGKSYKQIASAQHLSRDSVKYHAGKIYLKCGIKRRSELATRLLS